MLGLFVWFQHRYFLVCCPKLVMNKIMLINTRESNMVRNEGITE